MSTKRNRLSLSNLGKGGCRVAFLFVAMLLWVGAAQAQLPMGPSTQFDLTGFLEDATLDPACATNAHCGGTLHVNGHLVTVPAETIVIFPANALTWQEIFVQAPAPWGIPGNPGVTGLNGGISLPTSGMAAADCATGTSPCTAPPITTYEVHVIGNRVVGAADHYIAGLIYISQQGLNSGAGFINFIDYAKAEMRVGGTIGDATTGARVRINDPNGRFSLNTTSPDKRFTVDPDNPTIMAGTGYPMCLPRGTETGDALCPQGNRPLDGQGNPVPSITTNNASNPAFPIVPGFPDSHFQAPLKVGDYITFAGTLVKDVPLGGFAAGDGPTVGTWPGPPIGLGTASTYISAHTIVDNVAIYTWPGSDPAYVMTEVTLIGTGGLTVLGAGEAAVRTRFEGMTTDPSRNIHLYGIDLNPATGAVSDRDWGTIGVDQGAPNGAVKGRWRFRPPCLPFGSVPTKPDKECVMNALGTFLPPTREMRAVIEGLQSQSPSNPLAKTAANGINYGQYHAPILEYIFPENIPGTPIPENNFNTIDFLACGGYTSSGGTIAGQLNAWPSNVVPTLTGCAGFVAPPSSVVATATPSSVISGSGTSVTLHAAASGATPLNFLWTQAATDVNRVLPAGGVAGANATFVAPSVAANTTLNFTVTVTNSAGSASGTVTVPVSVDVPIVNHIPFQTVLSGTPATINIGGSDPGGLPLTFTVTQTGGPAPNLAPLTVTQLPPSGARAAFTHALPAGSPAVTLSFSVVATNTAGASSAPEFTQVTVSPQADSVVITSAEYRTGKQRLILNATSSVVSPNVVLTLLPYVTTAGTTFDPTALGATFTNNGGGLYILTLVGAPEPAVPPATPLVVTSNLGGRSAPSALTRIRQ